MPIKPEDQRPKVKRSFLFHPDIDSDLTAYCTQLKSSPDYVVNLILAEHLTKNFSKTTTAPKAKTKQAVA